MDINRLNPIIRSVSLYEKITRKEECVAYDSRLIYVVSGDICAVVDQKNLGHLSPGHLLYIPAGTRYKLKGQYLRAVVVTFDPTSDNPMPSERMNPVLTSEFDPSLCHSVSDFPPLDAPIHVEDMEAERDKFIKMADLFTSGEGYYLAAISAQVKLILLKLMEVSDENALPTRMVEALGEYIRENVSDDISNTEIGAIFGYHPFYVSRVIKERKGQTLRQYIITYRLNLSARLLELTNKSIAEIAEECGFTDASYFTKTFKSAMGITPKDYRNKFKEDFI